MDVAEQAESRLVVERVRDRQLGPRLERNIERVRVAERLRVPLEDQRLLVVAELLQDVVCDVRVGKLVLDDRDAGHEGVDAGSALGGHVIGRSRDQLSVAGDDERVLQLFQILGGHLRSGLDEIAFLQQVVEAHLVGRRHG